MKNIFKIALLVLAIILGFLVYNSVNSTVQASKEIENRFVHTIGQLKDVANAQRLYKDAQGKYAPTLDTLKSYLDTGKILIVNRRDSSFYAMGKRGVEEMKSITIYDTIVSPTTPKDSVFGQSDRFSSFGYVMAGENKVPIDFNAFYSDRVVGQDSTNVQRDHFFVGKVTKREVLKGIDEEEILRELYNEKSPIKDSVITIGSAIRPSLEGNWNTELETKLKEKREKELKARMKSDK